MHQLESVPGIVKPGWFWSKYLWGTRIQTSIHLAKFILVLWLFDSYLWIIESRKVVWDRQQVGNNPQNYTNQCLIPKIHPPKFHLIFKNLIREREREKEIEREIERERKISPICWLTPHMLTTAGVKPCWSQESRFQSGSPTWVELAQVVGHHKLPLRVCVSRKLKSEVELALKPRNFNVECKCPKWHLNCYVKHSPQSSLDLKNFYCYFSFLATYLSPNVALLNVLLKTPNWWGWYIESNIDSNNITNSGWFLSTCYA